MSVLEEVQRQDALRRYNRWMDDGFRGESQYGVKVTRTSGTEPPSEYSYDYSAQQAWLKGLRAQAGIVEPSAEEQAAQEWEQLRRARAARRGMQA